MVAAPRISSTVWLHVGLALCGVTDDARAVMRGEREPVLPTTLGEAIDRDFDDEHDASRFAAEVR